VGGHWAEVMKEFILLHGNLGKYEMQNLTGGIKLCLASTFLEPDLEPSDAI
jgi:hypothetical protein